MKWFSVPIYIIYHKFCWQNELLIPEHWSGTKFVPIFVILFKNKPKTMRSKLCCYSAQWLAKKKKKILESVWHSLGFWELLGLSLALYLFCELLDVLSLQHNTSPTHKGKLKSLKVGAGCPPVFFYLFISSQCRINSQQMDRWPKLITHHISAWNLQPRFCSILCNFTPVWTISHPFHHPTITSHALLSVPPKTTAWAITENPIPVSVNVSEVRSERAIELQNLMLPRKCNTSSEQH